MTRFRIFAVLLVALIALSSVLAACGGGSSEDPQQILDEATLHGIESANVDMALGLDLTGKEGGHVDVKLSGPFQTESEAELPKLDLSASAKGHLGNEDVDFEGGFTLLGDKAFVGYEGTEYEVDPSTFSFVRALIRRRTGVKDPSNEITACQEAAEEAAQLSDFVESPRNDGSVDVGGTSTTKISGNLDVVAAVDTAIALTEDPACSAQLQAAGSLPSKAKLEKSKREVERALKSAHIDLYVGDDHIVRRVVAHATIEPKGRKGAGTKSVEADFDLKLTGVNEEQSIEAPANSKPLSALFVKLGIDPLELLGLLQGGARRLQSPGGLNSLLERIGSGGLQ